MGDGVLLQVGQVGADERVDGVEPGVAVLLDAGTQTVRNPGPEGAAWLRRSRDGADEHTVEVNLSGHQGRHPLAGFFRSGPSSAVRVRIQAGRFSLPGVTGFSFRSGMDIMCAATLASVTAARGP